MKPRHPKYTIKQGDTLQSITQLFGVEVDVWTRYHNNMCRLDNVIREMLPKHLTEIYLLPELWEKEFELNTIEVSEPSEYNENKSIILHNRNVLFFAPQNINNKYGVVINFGKNQVHYKIGCKYLGKISDEVFQILLDREQVYINNQEPDLKLYELADKMAKAVYPLVLDMNRERNVTVINNYMDIVFRCEEAQKKLSQYYVGEFAERYIDAFSRQYSNPNNLINHIEQELFFQLFFLPIQGLYDNQKEKRIKYKHISSKNDITEYNLNVSLRPVYTRSGKLVADIESEEMMNANKCFQAEYLLYPEDHSIFAMRGCLIQKDRKGKDQNIRFEIYHLNKEERIIKRKILKV